MKYIAPIAVIAIWLVQASGVVPESSVGGPMTLALVFLGATLAVGIHEAWSNRRGVVGWIVSMVTALAGGFVAAEIGNFAIEPIMMLVSLNGSLASTGGPLLYIALAAMMLLMLLGAWTALQIISRWR